MKDEILDFLKNRESKLCVLATSSSNAKPECAVMGYAVLDDLSLVLSTDKGSRKKINLLENNRVSLVFGWGFDELNVQYEGIAELAEDGGENKKCEEIYFASHPESLEFKGTPETIFIKVKPTWLRLSDYTTDHLRIEETKIN